MHAIFKLGKRVENRRWNTKYRGPVLLHAAVGMTNREHAEAMMWMQRTGLIKELPPRGQFQHGGVCGRARIVDVIAPESLVTTVHVPLGPLFSRHATAEVEAVPVEELDDEKIRARGLEHVDLRWWFADQYGFVLEDVEELPFVPMRGMLGLFQIDEKTLPKEYR